LKIASEAEFEASLRHMREAGATCLKLQAAAADGPGGPRSRREQVAGRPGPRGSRRRRETLCFQAQVLKSRQSLSLRQAARRRKCGEATKCQLASNLAIGLVEGQRGPRNPFHLAKGVEPDLLGQLIRVTSLFKVSVAAVERIDDVYEIVFKYFYSLSDTSTFPRNAISGAFLLIRLLE
jgi:hypothetical protein